MDWQVSPIPCSHYLSLISNFLTISFVHQLYAFKTGQTDLVDYSPEMGHGGYTGLLGIVRQNHVGNCEEVKLCKILGLNVKLKSDESKFLPIMTVKWGKKVLKCAKCEVRSSRKFPRKFGSQKKIYFFELLIWFELIWGAPWFNLIWVANICNLIWVFKDLSQVDF